MAASTDREKILQRIKEALSNPVPLPFPESEGEETVFTTSAEETAIVFAEEFTKLQGKFSFCLTDDDLAKQLLQLFSEMDWNKVYCRENIFKTLLKTISVTPHYDLSTCDVSVTGCEFLVARTGTIVLSAAQPMGRTGSVYAPVHICIAFEDQLVYDVKDALTALKEKYGDSLPSFISFASGPSRTADIEKTLVTGVHGPKEVYCFLMPARK